MPANLYGMASFFRRWNMDAEQVLEQVALSVSACRKCDLHYSRKKAVPGEGPINSEIMLIGEGPGFYENEQGRPFVGAAGKIPGRAVGRNRYETRGCFYHQYREMPASE
jgi:uracil-DNA glycosylase